jgi:flagellar biosynthesis protein FlhF
MEKSDTPITIQGASYEACTERALELYSGRFKLLRVAHKKTGGFLGFLRKDCVELHGTLSPDMSKYALGIYNTAAQCAAPPPAAELSEKEKILAEAQKRTGADPKLTQILAEVKNLSEKLDEKITAETSEEHENILRLEGLLEQNDFLPAFRKKIIARIKKELSYETLNNYPEVEQQTLEWIGDSIEVYEEEKQHKRPRVIIIVGATGIGKTTTVAKLAARFAFASRHGQPHDYKTALLTIDKYRVGADEQLQKYADILHVPFDTASDEAEYKRKLTLLGEDADVVIVDTIGRSPRDSRELAEMKQMLDAYGRRGEVFLALSAATKASDIVTILKQFAIFDYRSVIVTKIDETAHAGNVISALSEQGKSVVFIADGQKVPENLQKAHPIRLLVNLDGFDVNRDRLEKHFGVDCGRPG